MRYRVVTFGLAFVLAASLLIFPVFAQSSTQFFGCQRYAADVVHCNPMLGPMEGLEVRGNWTMVHPLSSGESIFVPGKVGNATEIRAEYRESIEIMNTPDLNPEEFTVSFWIKQTRTQPYSHIISHTNKAQTTGWFFDMFASNSAQGGPASSLRFGVPNSNGTIFAPPEIPLPVEDAFVHIAGTFDGSTLRLYKDGEEAGTAEFGGNYTSDPGVPIRIGSAAYCSSCNRWAGVIDEVKIYSRAVAPEEARQLHDTAGSSDGLIGHWPLDTDGSDALSGNDGTSTTLITSMTFAPDGRLFISEKNTGEVRVMTPDFELLDEPFARIDDVYASWEQGLLGIAVDPDFEQNHYVYLYYTALVDTTDGNGGKVVNRLVRFTEDNSKGTEMTVLMDNIPASRGFHSGGAVGFGADGKLYFTVGDATEHVFAQDPGTTVGKVLRINKDGSIPNDNPYPGSPVYTVGHRNMYGIAFDSDGTGLITENGDFHYDELNVLIKGANYGFPTLQPPNLPPELVNNSSIKPVRTYWDAIAPTQMIYYTGDSLPDFQGMFMFGAFTGDIYAVRLSENKTRIEVEQKIELAHFPFIPAIAIAQAPDGNLYYGGYQIYRLESVSDPTRNVHQVAVELPDGAELSDLQLDLETDMMVLDVELREALDSGEMSVRFPNGLVNNITAVGIEASDSAASRELEFDVTEDQEGYDTVRISLGEVQQGALRIAIMGTAVMPEFSAPLVIMALSVISTLTVGLLFARRAR